MAAIATASFFMAVSRSIRDYHAACRRLLPLQHREFETVGRALYKVAALNCSERLIMLWDSSARIGAQRPARDDAGNKKAADDMALGSDNHFWGTPSSDHLRVDLGLRDTLLNQVFRRTEAHALRKFGGTRLPTALCSKFDYAGVDRR
jgi:hypothetical protein